MWAKYESPSARGAGGRHAIPWYPGRTLFRVASCLALLCLGVAQADADLLKITITSDLGQSLTVQDGQDGFDRDLLPHSISIDESVLLSFFPQLNRGTTISTTSNQATLDTFRRLEVASRLVSGGLLGVTYTIASSQSDFLLPEGPERRVTESVGGTFTNAPTDNSVTFEGAYSANNNMFDFSSSVGVLGPLNSSSLLDTNAYAANGGPVFFLDNDTYAISSRSIIVASPTSVIQTTSTVRVDAVVPAVVPEPGSLALVSLCGIGFCASSVRRRLKKAAA